METRAFCRSPRLEVSFSTTADEFKVPRGAARQFTDLSELGDDDCFLVQPDAACVRVCLCVRFALTLPGGCVCPCLWGWPGPTG